MSSCAWQLVDPALSEMTLVEPSSLPDSVPKGNTKNMRKNWDNLGFDFFGAWTKIFNRSVRSLPQPTPPHPRPERQDSSLTILLSQKIVSLKTTTVLHFQKALKKSMSIIGALLVQK